MFEINVIPDDSKNGIFKITGNFIGFVGAEAESIDGDNKLDVMVTDSSEVAYSEFGLLLAGN